MSLHCKARLMGKGNTEEEIRRFKVDQNVAANFEYLKSKIIAVFPSIKNDNFKVFWKDEEGDLIEFSTDEELVDGLAQTRSAGDLFNITIKKIEEQGSSSKSYPRGDFAHFLRNPNQDPRCNENWQNQPRPPAFNTWHAARHMTDPRFAFSDPMASYHNPWQYQRFPGPQSWYGSPGEPFSSTHQFYAGDERTGAAGYRGPRGNYSSSWMTSGEDDKNVQVQQQSQSNETNSTKEN